MSVKQVGKTLVPCWMPAFYTGRSKGLSLQDGALIPSKLELQVDEEQTVASPCINVCVIDECTGFCAGCLRTVDEIAGWGSKANNEKREILTKVDVRRELVRQTQQERT